MATEETLRVFGGNCNKDYCSFKEFLRHKPEEHKSLAIINCSGCDGNRNCEARRTISHIDDRVLLQFKEVEKFKLIESQKQGRDIGWNEAGKLWAEGGYAARFSKSYEEEKRRDSFYVLSS